MLKTPLAILAVAATMAAAPTAALAGPPNPLKATTVLNGYDAPQVAEPGALAFRTSDGTAGVIDDALVQQRVPPVAGCRFAAAGGNHLAWDCGGELLQNRQNPSDSKSVRHVAITDLAGTVLARPDVILRDGQPSAPDVVGSQWLRVSTPGNKSDARWVQNWRTGELRSGQDDAQATHFDYDAATLVLPYCAPIQAQAVAWSDSYSGPSYRPVEYRGGWAIVDTRTGHPVPTNPVHHELRRCGLARPVKAPASLTTAIAVTLGDGWVAWRPRGTAARLHVMRLSDRRRWVVAARGRAMLTAASLWVADDATRQVSWARLPRG
ncbi:MAG TPA: hypothetical protein VK501_03895 [Baekduia sp.]|uniref:hypothetical protein n=1 Tax=Baekduia sp. TaxID=2600305 RepID=UPI002BC1C7B8|nr:hypothetical protein [Baekduia sp.]HMJ33038.1 hypothetical protein [Baekduia sp.]